MRWLCAAAILTGCAGDKDETQTATDATPCEGAGDPVLQLGTGGQLGFTPFADGDIIDVVQDPSDRFGLFIDLSTTGLDTTLSVTSFLRYTIGDDPETTDAGASLLLQCSDAGVGWFGVFAPLGDDLQTAIDVVEIDGLPLHLTGSATDDAGETGSFEVDLVLSYIER